MKIFNSKQHNYARNSVASTPRSQFSPKKTTESGKKILAKRVTRGINYFTGSMKFRHVLSRPQSPGEEEVASPLKRTTTMRKVEKADDVDSVLADAERALEDAAQRGVTDKQIKGAKALRKQLTIARTRGNTSA